MGLLHHQGGPMRKVFRLRTLILIVIAAGIGAVVALVVNQKQKFSGMSEEEIREYLDLKLAGRMSDEQVAQIQDAVISAVKRSPEVADMVEEAIDEAIDEVEEEAEIEEAAEELVEETDES
jgi:ketopantoate reductase